MERIRLTASNGMWLTDGEAYGRIVYLGINDKPENWHEITEEEYQKTMQAEES